MAQLKFDHALRLKITLEGLRPPVWRRIEIPCTATFWDLHVAIQDAMGWNDSHLHMFQVTLPLSEAKFEIGIPYDGLDLEDPEMLLGWHVFAAEVLTLVNRQCRYQYDFGDDWHHRVLLEKIVPRVADTAYPRCIGGKRACPPDDVGGVMGYALALAAIADPADEEHDDWVGWMPAGFDPGQFDPAAVAFDDPDERFRIAFGE